MYRLLRGLLFRLDAETAHHLTLNVMHLVGSCPPLAWALTRTLAPPRKPVHLMGLSFPNPLGLAAGYDKDARAWRGLAFLGFGHIEIGTVTLQPQPGNPRPRIFRLPEQQALINRMGFPSKGAAYVLRQLPRKFPQNIILGVNLGKNRDTPLADAVGEYLQLLESFAPYAHYVTINVSSPNTEGLRRLQARKMLNELLKRLVERRDDLVKSLQRSLPLLVKLSPDMTSQELNDAVEVIVSNGVEGVVATNTTVRREGISHPLTGEAGGLSGAPLFSHSLKTVEHIRRLAGERLVIIGSGGVMNAARAQAMLNAGANLVQIYTALIYAGPGVVRGILRG